MELNKFQIRKIEQLICKDIREMATVGNEFMGWIDLWVTKASEVKKNGFICDKKIL